MDEWALVVEAQSVQSARLHLRWAVTCVSYRAKGQVLRQGGHRGGGGSGKCLVAEAAPGADAAGGRHWSLRG